MARPDLTHYAPILVRSGIVNDKERKFCASVIRQTRSGKPITDKQHAWLEALVARLWRNAKDDEVVE